MYQDYFNTTNLQALSIPGGKVKVPGEEGIDTYYYSVKHQPLRSFTQSLFILQWSDLSLSFTPEGISVDDFKGHLITNNPSITDGLKLISSKYVDTGYIWPVTLYGPGHTIFIIGFFMNCESVQWVYLLWVPL